MRRGDEDGGVGGGMATSATAATAVAIVAGLNAATVLPGERESTDAVVRGGGRFTQVIPENVKLSKIKKMTAVCTLNWKIP